jgi:uncharacterized C2H2 Zn-finger protein
VGGGRSLSRACVCLALWRSDRAYYEYVNKEKGFQENQKKMRKTKNQTKTTLVLIGTRSRAALMFL